MRIALVDDEKILLDHLTRILEELVPGAEISPFSSSSDLLWAAKQTSFDIIFLDIRMPGLSGIELAEMLREVNPQVNLIFVTGFDGYQDKALELFASGYVKKPVTKEKITEQLSNLRYGNISAFSKRVYVKTFGNFTVFVDGKTVMFGRSKSQMILAYLVHKQGALISRRELARVMFGDNVYDANRQSYMSKLCKELEATLKENNISDLIRISSSGLAVNTQVLDCDFYDYLAGKRDSKNSFRGEYMHQYDFGKEMIETLKNM